MEGHFTDCPTGKAHHIKQKKALPAFRKFAVIHDKWKGPANDTRPAERFIGDCYSRHGVLYYWQGSISGNETTT